MTDLERLAAVLRKASTLEPDVSRAILQAWDELRRSLSLAELEQLIRSASPERLLSEVLSPQELDRLFADLRIELQRALEEAARHHARVIPGVAPRTVFGVLNPHVLAAVQALDDRVVSELKRELRASFRGALLEGLEAGHGPRVIARRARDSIGLAPNQRAAVRNFRQLLIKGDRNALRRKLRDRRFDRTLDRALGARGTGLGRAQIDRMAEAYERRMIAHNAELNARTASVDAMKMGQRLSWEEAILRGTVPRERLMRRWAAVGGPLGDGRNRPEHLAMHGERRQFDEPYSNGQTVPGEDEFNCRCIEVFYIAAEVRLAA